MFATARFCAALLGLGLLVPWISGCEGTVCGPGTREVDFKCVPLSLITGDGGIHCGEKTVLVGNECVPAQEICGPFTNVVFEQDEQGNATGAFYCRGTEGATPIDEGLLPCPDEFGPAGQICINGWVHWLLDEQNGVYLASRVANPDADATDMAVRVYDPLLYAEDPANVQPIAMGEVNPKTGAYRILDMMVPSNGLIALVVDDLNELQTNNWAMTGAPWPAVPSENSEGLIALAISQEQITTWTEKIGGEAKLQAIGCAAPPAGQPHTILTCGSWFGIFATVDLEAEDVIGSVRLIEGVQASIPGGPIPSDRRFYPGIDADGKMVFDDPTEGVVWSDGDGPHDWTGKLGTVLYPSASLQNMQGACQIDTPCMTRGCIWNEILGGAIPGVILTQFMTPIKNTCSD